MRKERFPLLKREGGRQCKADRGLNTSFFRTAGEEETRAEQGKNGAPLIHLRLSPLLWRRGTSAGTWETAGALVSFPLPYSETKRKKEAKEWLEMEKKRGVPHSHLPGDKRKTRNEAPLFSPEPPRWL